MYGIWSLQTEVPALVRPQRERWCPISIACMEGAEMCENDDLPPSECSLTQCLVNQILGQSCNTRLGI